MLGAVRAGSPRRTIVKPSPKPVPPDRANAGEDPIEIGCAKGLFVDHFLIARSHGVRLRLHPPRKTGERLIVSDRPWEDATLNWFSIVREGRRWRMWYEAYDVAGWPTSDDTSFCVAESDDGIRWRKPEWDLHPYRGSPRSNILFRMVGMGAHRSRVHGSCVFLDPGAPREERYKCISQGQFASEGTPPHRVAGMTSPDGIHWKRIPEPICRVFADSQYSAYRDPQTGELFAYGRVAGRFGRAIGSTRGKAFQRFRPFERVLEAGIEDASDVDLYNPAAIPYPGVDGLHLMFPSRFDHRSDTIDIGLAVSRDGVHWTWPDRGTPFVALGPRGDFDSGSLYMGNGACQPTADGWSFYYSGSPLRHGEVELDRLADPANRRVITRAVGIPDRLVSVSSDPGGGRLETRLLSTAGTDLLIYATTSAHGTIRVEMRDAEGHPVPGRRARECRPLHGDLQWRSVRWYPDGGWDTPPIGLVRLVFELRDADLHGFRFVRRG